MATPRPKLVRLVTLGVLAVIAFFLVQQHGLVPLVRRLLDALRDAGPLPLFTALAIMPAFGVPVSVFTFPAAGAFVPVLGVGGVIAATIAALGVNMALSYWLAAHALRPLVELVVRKLGYEVPRLPAGTERDVILLVRIIPGPPFFLQSYLLGLARVPFVPYLLLSLLVSGTYAALTIIALAGVIEGNPILLVVAAIALPVVFFSIRRLRARLRAAGTAPRPDPAD